MKNIQSLYTKNLNVRAFHLVATIPTMVDMNIDVKLALAMCKRQKDTPLVLFPKEVQLSPSMYVSCAKISEAMVEALGVKDNEFINIAYDPNQDMTETGIIVIKAQTQQHPEWVFETDL